MHILSTPAEASARLGSFIVEAMTGAQILLSAVLALATIASVA